MIILAIELFTIKPPTTEFEVEPFHYETKVWNNDEYDIDLIKFWF